MLFADDVLFFAKVDDITIRTIKNTINNFCQVSEMDINLEKSKVWLSPATPQDMRNAISNFF